MKKPLGFEEERARRNPWNWIGLDWKEEEDPPTPPAC